MFREMESTRRDYELSLIKEIKEELRRNTEIINIHNQFQLEVIKELYKLGEITKERYVESLKRAMDNLERD